MEEEYSGFGSSSKYTQYSVDDGSSYYGGYANSAVVEGGSDYYADGGSTVFVPTGNNVDDQEVVYYQPPEGHNVDSEGRLLKDPHEIIDTEYMPENDFDAYTAHWQNTDESKPKDLLWSSQVVWPYIADVVHLKRLDIFEQSSPKLQIACTILEESRLVRATAGLQPYLTLFFLDKPTSITKDLLIETAAPPRRSKFRPADKQNTRDFTKWITVDRLHAYLGPAGIPGTR